jgi:hypothetical protein
MNEDLRQLFQYLVRTHWTFMHEDWPVVENKKHHRSETKEIGQIYKNKLVLLAISRLNVYDFLINL